MTLQSISDVMGLLAIFIIVVLVVAPLSPGRLLAWVLEEWRIARLDTWADGRYDAPRTCTVADPRVAKVVLKQRALGRRMRKQGRTLLAHRDYEPELHQRPAPKNVVQLRRPTETKGKAA